MSQKQSELESALTDQALTPETERSAKEAKSIMPNFSAPVLNSSWQMRLASGNPNFRKYCAYDTPASARKMRRMMKKKGAK
jgi:hypothetical protein